MRLTMRLNNGYTLKTLCTDDDFGTVFECCRKCSDYYLLHSGVLPAEKDITGIFNALPPNKSYEDKFVLGIFTPEQKLAGIIDFVRDYPDEGEWMLGLMLIVPDERGKGLGTMVHQTLREWAVSQGATSFRIGVIQENVKGSKFWSHLGYKKIKETEIEFTAKKHIVYVMRLTFGMN